MCFYIVKCKKNTFFRRLKSLFLVPEMSEPKKLPPLKVFETLISPAMENEKYVKMFYCYEKRRKIVEGILSFQFDN